jgi:hypothetical protein
VKEPATDGAMLWCHSEALSQDRYLNLYCHDNCQLTLAHLFVTGVQTPA